MHNWNDVFEIFSSVNWIVLQSDHDRIREVVRVWILYSLKEMDNVVLISKRTLPHQLGNIPIELVAWLSTTLKNLNKQVILTIMNDLDYSINSSMFFKPVPGT